MRLLTALFVAASLAACSAPRAQSAEKPGIPKVVQPNGGKTGARADGFGALAPLVP